MIFFQAEQDEFKINLTEVARYLLLRSVFIKFDDSEINNFVNQNQVIRF